MAQILYKEEVYTIVGYCIEVWKVLGYGFSEIIYKDAMEQEFTDNILPYIREDELSVYYKGKQLKHKFNADFTLFENIIVEVKSGDDGIIEKMIQQVTLRSEEISLATQQQNSAVSQIIASMQGVERVAHENASSVSEISSSVNQIDQISAQIKEALVEMN